MSATIKVSVFRCSKCGHEDFSLRGRKPRPECPRCGNAFMPRRVIANPRPDTVRQAEREDAARSAGDSRP